MAELKTFQPADLLGQLLGQKTTGSTTSNANTGPLQQVFDRASQPMDRGLYDQLIASIFGTAGQQVPGITAALANATGTRSSGNSPLALALTELNNKAAADSAQAILGQQNTQAQLAGNAASGIASATKSSTSAEKTGTGVNPLVTLLGGFALNKADKMFGLAGGDGAAAPSNFSFAPTDYGNIPEASFGSAPDSGFSLTAPGDTSSFGFGGGGFDFGGVSDWMPDLGASSEMLWPVDDSIDFGQFFADGGQPDPRGMGLMASRPMAIDAATDAATAGQDPNAALMQILMQALSRPPQSTAPTGPVVPSPGFAGSLQQIMQFMRGQKMAPNPPRYADGGPANPAMRTQLRPNYAPAINNVVFGYADGGPMMPSGYGGFGNPLAPRHFMSDSTFGPDQIRTVPRGYADGGVVRNRNNMGGPLAKSGSFSINSNNSGGNQGINSSMLTDMVTRATRSAQQTPDAESGLDTQMSPERLGALEQYLAFDASQNYKGRDAAMKDFAKVAMGLGLSMIAPQALAVTGLTGITKSPMSLFSSLLQKGVQQQNAMVADNALGQATVTNPNSDAISGLISLNDGFSSSPGPDPAGTTQTSLDGFLSLNDNFGTSAPVGDTAGAGGAGATTDTGGDLGVNFSDGGMLKGPGSGTSDSIKARSKSPGSPQVLFSDEEFIIPADVVRQPGMRQHFEGLIKKYHAPVRR